MEFNEIISRIYRLPSESLEKLLVITEEVSLRRHTVFMHSGHRENYIYFLKSGIVRAFVETGGKEVTFWIGEEGSVSLSMNSYVSGRPGYESIATVSDCIFFRIGLKDLEYLYATDLEIANWGRKFAESEILRAEQCLIPLLFTTGKERYRYLLERNPGLLNRIPLEHLASYLGISAVSLSRIRASLYD